MPDHAPPPEQDLGPDRELIARLAANDDGAWEEFHQRFLPRIGACVRRAGVRDGDLDDACSFVLESLLADGCRRLRQWDGRASLSTYLYAVTSNLARDFLRQKPRVVFAGEERIPHADPNAPVFLEPETHALQAWLRDAILACLFQMPTSADREILLLRYYAGLSTQEIADFSGRTRNAVDQALYRAHRHLRRIAEQVRPELLEYLREDGHGGE